MGVYNFRNTPAHMTLALWATTRYFWEKKYGREMNEHDPRLRTLFLVSRLALLFLVRRVRWLRYNVLYIVREWFLVNRLVSPRLVGPGTRKPEPRHNINRSFSVHPRVWCLQSIQRELGDGDEVREPSH